MKMTYLPRLDKGVLQISNLSGKKKHVIGGNLEVTYNNEGQILKVAIENYSEQLKQFLQARGVVRLDGIWKGVNITEDDVKNAREELLNDMDREW